MIVKCPKCGRMGKEHGGGSFREKGQSYKFKFIECEQCGFFGFAVPDIAPVVMPEKKRRNGYYD